MRVLPLIFFVSLTLNNLFAQGVDSFNYLSNETQEIIEDIDNQSEVYLHKIEIKEDNDLVFQEFFDPNIPITREERVALTAKDNSYLTPVVGINTNGKKIYKPKSEAVSVIQSDGTNVYYADSDRIYGAYNVLPGARILIINIKK
ncbi:hypothetical protein KMW28_11245 [Flammeovirga yaeyamensis]|uniref:Uncharacterized protein n=1 Tax=Flammeovirga yaeyamensis TaxID=367791 RepID=A0AAX1MYS7_9BACT|nr:MULTISPECIES: hypothetical protein [Flammeovirga]ANQ48365.1 hypothetical protein MY04_0983 [Flammeovirga sp. MY04]MBB3696267.1 acid phosphatase class B [Flammeovirga yaeyamensis]NMF34948.1 hypothetical protein [Flammeovirga yaeyamensis]QWG00227.1 hypothetical protein KMW28_11245 [Flammeovirga yaeyamensis]